MMWNIQFHNSEIQCIMDNGHMGTPMWTDRHDQEYYLPSTLLAGGNNENGDQIWQDFRTYKLSNFGMMIKLHVRFILPKNEFRYKRVHTSYYLSCHVRIYTTMVLV